MALERMNESEIKALLPNQENTQGSLSLEAFTADFQADRKKERIAACFRECGLTKREIENARTEFKLTDDNRNAYEAACEFSDGTSNLLLCGEAGRGKSRLAHGVVLREVEAGKNAVFWTTTKYLMVLRAESLESNEICAIKKFTSMKTLVLDDFGANKITEWSLMMMDTVVDSWYRHGRKGLVITSNFSLDRIGSEISDRIASRLAEMCRVFDMKGKDWRVS